MELTINTVSSLRQVERSRVDEPSPASKQQDVLVERAGEDRMKRVPEAQEVHRAAERLNEALKTFNRNLAVSVQEDGKMVVQVTDPLTGDVIRQIPPEQILEVEENLDNIVGLFVNDIA